MRKARAKRYLTRSEYFLLIKLFKYITISLSCFLVYYLHDWAFIYYYVYYTDNVELESITRNRKSGNLLPNRTVYVSPCSCKSQKDVILVEKSLYQNKYNVFSMDLMEYYSKKGRRKNRVSRNASGYLSQAPVNTKLLYEIDGDELNSAMLTCDAYSSLRRGPRSKIFSMSFSGQIKQALRYRLQLTSKWLKENLPDWTLRVYHDSSLDTSYKCELECFAIRSENEQFEEDQEIGKKDFVDRNLKFLDNIDFCNIDQLPYDLVDKAWTADYMHDATWKWLPFGDSFVDVFEVRDLDNFFTYREKDSIMAWLDAGSLYHIMRDHPSHKQQVINGLWGFANRRNRTLAEYLFKLITNKHVASHYNPTGQNEQDYDMAFLNNFIVQQWSNHQGAIHDSFYCNKWPQSSPWPGKRMSYFCYVGCKYGENCCISQKPQDYYDTGTTLARSNFICPRSCRPKQHPDWAFC